MNRYVDKREKIDSLKKRDKVVPKGLKKKYHYAVFATKTNAKILELYSNKEEEDLLKSARLLVQEREIYVKLLN